MIPNEMRVHVTHCLLHTLHEHITLGAMLPEICTFRFNSLRVDVCIYARVATTMPHSHSVCEAVQRSNLQCIPTLLASPPSSYGALFCLSVHSQYVGFHLLEKTSLPLGIALYFTETWKCLSCGIYHAFTYTSVSNVSVAQDCMCYSFKGFQIVLFS